jgi:hypothetical protein
MSHGWRPTIFNQVRCSGCVSRILCPTVHPRERGRWRGDDHSSRPGITGGLKRPTRRLRTGRPQTPPYLALLRAGFCLPHPLRAARCALTAPFHPYRPRLLTFQCRIPAGGMFSVPLSFELPRPGITRRTALWSSDFPPSAFTRFRAIQSDGGRPTRCNGKLILAGHH